MHGKAKKNYKEQENMYDEEDGGKGEKMFIVPENKRERAMKREEEEGFEQKKEEGVDEMSRNREREKGERQGKGSEPCDPKPLVSRSRSPSFGALLYRSIEVPKVKHGVLFRRICL